MNKWVLYSLILFVSLITIAVSCTIDTLVSEVIKNPISETDSVLVKVYDLLNSESTQLNSVTSTDSLTTSYYSIILDDCPWLIPKINKGFQEIIHSYNRNFQISSSTKNSLHHSLLASKYYDKIHYNQDSCFHYARLAYEKVKSLDDDHLLKYLAVCQLIRASEYQRNSLLAIGIENEFLNEFHDKNNLCFQSVYQNRIVTLIKLRKYRETQSEMNRLSEYVDTLSNYSKLKYLECQLINAIHNQETKATPEPIISEIEEVRTNIKVYDINFDRLIGQYYTQKELIELALKKLHRAKSFEEQKVNYNNAQMETIHFLLSQLMESKGEYTKAKNTYLGNVPEKVKFFISNPERLEELNINDLISIQRIADILKSSGLNNNNIDHSIQSKTLYLKSIELMNKTLERYDEETLLRYFNYQTDIINQLVKINKQLYNETPDSNLMLEIADFILSKNNLRFKYETLINRKLYAAGNKAIETLKENELLLKKKSIDSLTKSSKLYDFSINQLSLREQLVQDHDSSTPLLNYKNRFENTLGQSNETWLLYSFIEKHLLILLWKDQKLSLNLLKFGTQELEQLNRIIDWQSDPIFSGVSEYENLSYDLYLKLIPPSVREEDKINVILDGLLNFLSFDALTIKPQESENFSGVNYLIKQTQVNRYFSEEQMNNNRYETKNTHVYSYSTKESIKSNKSELPELPAAVNETNIVESSLSNTKVYEGQDCSIKQFIESLKKSNTNIHLATHGYANAQERDQLKLYFRNGDMSTDSLYAYELIPHQIKASKIILSACQSAYGKSETVEGIYNWPRYLLQQGAQSVISTLWLLNDHSGSEIFKHYYHGKQNLRTAKLNYLNEGKFPAHPYYWAALVEY